MRDYPAFDWLRLILASAVFWDHAGVFGHLSVGHSAVNIFFALSGWLIGGILLNMTPGDVPRFFYNRVMRIWLPYLAAAALLYGAAMMKEGYAPYFFQTLAFDLTLTHNLFIEKIPAVITNMPLDGTGAHFWSIAVEEQFYLLAPLLVVLTRFGRSPVAWFGLTLLAILAGTFYASVAAGVFAVTLRERVGPWHLTAGGTLALAAILLASGVLAHTGVVEGARVLPVASAAIVLLLARPGLRGGTGKWAGGISYPMYLNHWTGLFAAGMLLHVLPQAGRPVALAFGFLVALAVAAVAYRLIDRQVHAVRARHYTPARGRMAMLAAYGLMALGLLLGTQVIGPLAAAPPG